MNRPLFVAVLVALLVSPIRSAQSQAPTCDGRPVTTSGTEGTDGDDVIVGTEGADTIYGGNGNDTICGLGGNDVLIGYLGDDHLEGGDGSDRLYGCDPSHGRSDVVVCTTYEGGGSDADVLLGGPDDDHLFAHVSADSLDGGDGYDVLDGGEADDDCAGERYTRCESMNPPEPPPACMDGADNDGDGATDTADAECSRERDPTEDVANDPVCFNGNDDDGDGWRDYPEDLGCNSFEQQDEIWCHGFCPAVGVSIDRKLPPDAFTGDLFDREACLDRRTVVVKRVRPGRDKKIGEDRDLRSNGRWWIPADVEAGRYYAKSPALTYSTVEGDDPVCDPMRSRTTRVS